MRIFLSILLLVTVYFTDGTTRDFYEGVSVNTVIKSATGLLAGAAVADIAYYEIWDSACSFLCYTSNGSPGSVVATMPMAAIKYIEIK